MKRTKIVATIGPASAKKEVLRKMIKEGMNVVRLNFSHGDFKWHENIIKTVRLLSEKMKVPVGIMADLQGPRIRVKNELEFSVRDGETVLVAEDKGKLKKNGNGYKIIYLDLEDVVKMVKNGSDILIEDGLIKLKVIAKNKKHLHCVVIDGGTIKSQKGVNIPGISSLLGALTSKDKEVLDFSLRHDVDFVAMSFVRTAGEIKKLKNIIKKKTGKKNIVAQVIAKIERQEAVKNFNDILKVTDGVMVARGDLGVEIPQADLPVIQKEIIAKCLLAGKPVIVATQMLDSMIHNPRPTRAEISDVSNAVIDHADAVMLSGETANGKYPVESVQTMREIIEKTEESPFDDLEHGFLDDKKSSISAAVAHTAHELLKDSGSKAIAVASMSGFTARMIARHRPEQNFYVMTNNEKVHNQLTLVWGAESFVLPDCKTLEDLLNKSIETVKKNKLVNKGDKIVLVAGRPHAKKEHMSLVKVEEIK
jgi:pyruvate kinase